MLKVNNLTATNLDVPLIKNINLDIKPNEIHAIIGPKYSGKSALAHSIMGHPSVHIESGSIFFNRRKLNSLPTKLRNQFKIFVSFQTPPIFPGISSWNLFREFFNVPKSSLEKIKLKYIAACELLNLGDGQNLDTDSYDATLSQAKRNELIYMLLSDPKLVILDEIDDGLTDKESALAGLIIKEFVRENNRACLLITRNKSLLDIVEPTHVHLMSHGEIRMSGGNDLYKRIVDDEYTEFS